MMSAATGWATAALDAVVMRAREITTKSLLGALRASFTSLLILPLVLDPAREAPIAAAQRTVLRGTDWLAHGNHLFLVDET